MSTPEPATRGGVRQATLLALVAAALLTVALFSPVIRYSELGAPRDYSLLGGIVQLLGAGEWLVGGVLLVFSVLFPFAKLAAIIAADTAPPGLGPAARARLVALADRTGRYSMLDVFVVAVTVGLVKFHGIVEAVPRYGILVFCTAILVSLAAGRKVRLDEAGEERAAGAAVAARRGGGPAGAPPRRWRLAAAGVILLLAACAALAAAQWWARGREPIRAVRVEPRPGLQIPSLGSLLGSADTDLMVVVRAGGREVRSTPARDTVLGNGIDLVLEQTVRRGAIEQVALFDPRDSGMARVVGWFSGPKAIDRVDQVQDFTDGGRFRFILLPAPRATAPRRALVVMGGVLLVLGVALLTAPLVRRPAAS
jgi:hypothetical protein